MKLKLTLCSRQAAQARSSRNRSRGNADAVRFAQLCGILFVLSIFLARAASGGMRKDSCGLKEDASVSCLGNCKVSKSGGIILGRAGTVPSLASTSRCTSICGGFQP